MKNWRTPIQRTILYMGAGSLLLPSHVGASGQFTTAFFRTLPCSTMVKQVFDYTGSVQYSISRPAGCDLVAVKMWGAGGGGAMNYGGTGNHGGPGAFVAAGMVVPSSAAIELLVGGSGGGGSQSSGGLGSMGSGGSGSLGSSASSGAGGGLSFLRYGSTFVVAAGAGGGAGAIGSSASSYGSGGAGGDATGFPGENGDSSITGGVGGASASGGAGGVGAVSGTAGSFASGGSAQSVMRPGGGGGSGYYGGGGGGGSSVTTGAGGGGGGGSSYINPSYAAGIINTSNSGATPPKSGDPDIGSAGVATGGASSVYAAAAQPGGHGRIVLLWGFGVYSVNTATLSNATGGLVKISGAGFEASSTIRIGSWQCPAGSVIFYGPRQIGCNVGASALSVTGVQDVTVERTDGFIAGKSGALNVTN